MQTKYSACFSAILFKLHVLKFCRTAALLFQQVLVNETTITYTRWVSDPAGQQIPT